MMSTTTPRRQFLKWAGRIMAAITLPMGCSLPSQGKADKTITSLTLPPKNPILSTTQPMNNTHTPQIPLEEKIGQMLMVGFRGLTVDSNHPIVKDLQQHHLGGVILFDYDVALKKPQRNIQSPAQVKKLVEQLQQFAHKPLLVAIDYEGGMINRLGEQLGFPKTVSFAYLGKVNDMNVTRQHAMEMAHTLAQLGINLNMAPVVDLALNAHNPIIARHQRSFSADPEIVTRQALEFIKAHHRYNILTTLKHFPGHGSSTTDSHQGFVDVTQTWSRQELQPYINILQADKVDAIMTAHVFNAHLDPHDPATLSYPIMNGLLRQQLNYNGVVISDDMQMKAIRQHYDLKTALHKAITAGVDIIVFGNNTGVFEAEITLKAKTLIQQLVEAGQISTSHIDAAYQRICRLKQKVTAIECS